MARKKRSNNNYIKVLIPVIILIIAFVIYLDRSEGIRNAADSAPKDLHIRVDEVVPGVFNMVVDKKAALSYVPGLTTDDSLELVIDEERTLSLAYNQKLDVFYVTNVQGVNMAELGSAKIARNGIIVTEIPEDGSIKFNETKEGDLAEPTDPLVKKDDTKDSQEAVTVKASELGISIDQILSGVYNLEIPMDVIKSVVPGSDENSKLQLIFNANKALEFDYNNDSDAFYKTGVQGYTPDEIRGASVVIIK